MLPKSISVRASTLKTRPSSEAVRVATSSASDRIRKRPNPASGWRVRFRRSDGAIGPVWLLVGWSASLFKSETDLRHLAIRDCSNRPVTVAATALLVLPPDDHRQEEHHHADPRDSQLGPGIGVLADVERRRPPTSSHGLVSLANLSGADMEAAVAQYVGGCPKCWSIPCACPETR